MAKRSGDGGGVGVGVRGGNSGYALWDCASTERKHKPRSGSAQSQEGDEQNVCLLVLDGNPLPMSATFDVSSFKAENLLSRHGKILYYTLCKNYSFHAMLRALSLMIDALNSKLLISV